MKLLQIHHDDLAALEELVPEMCENLAEKTSNADRVKIRRVKEILSNVRWSYQPHSEIERIDP